MGGLRGEDARHVPDVRDRRDRDRRDRSVRGLLLEGRDPLGRVSSGNKAVWAVLSPHRRDHAFYMFRLVFLTFYAEVPRRPPRVDHAPRVAEVDDGPLMILALLSFVGVGSGVPKALTGSTSTSLHQLARAGRRRPHARTVPHHSTAVELALMGAALAIGGRGRSPSLARVPEERGVARRDREGVRPALHARAQPLLGRRVLRGLVAQALLTG